MLPLRAFTLIQRAVLSLWNELICVKHLMYRPKCRDSVVVLFLKARKEFGIELLRQLFYWHVYVIYLCVRDLFMCTLCI